MAKYSFEVKISIVHDYLNGKGGYVFYPGNMVFQVKMVRNSKMGSEL